MAYDNLMLVTLLVAYILGSWCYRIYHQDDLPR